NMINRIILQNDGFLEAATLITGNNVLIAYSKENEFESASAANIAKRSAQSVMPENFDVFVSEKVSIMKELQQLHNSDVREIGYNNKVNRIINEMKKSRQGADDS